MHNFIHHIYSFVIFNINSAKNFDPLLSKSFTYSKFKRICIMTLVFSLLSLPWCLKPCFIRLIVSLPPPPYSSNTHICGWMVDIFSTLNVSSNDIQNFSAQFQKMSGCSHSWLYLTSKHIICHYDTCMSFSSQLLLLDNFVRLFTSPLKIYTKLPATWLRWAHHTYLCWAHA